ncbi:MAG: hypothetical protein Satyrvirus1_2 [Satyrvirus sp.]|uniref:Fe2OG dioxygenase domain-containing protein n=1 Tax=Satyrvirus sp. TaxID=2487771 RepID=A0A3G5ACH7_9VIRU|nr:MAG: hypothetical protein Satyrvirus1_2 [Satyrvirus sp.]
MENLNFENAFVMYNKNYLSGEVPNYIFNFISNMFDKEEKKIINDDTGNPLYKLNRKTIVFVDDDVDQSVIPKIWGSGVSIFQFPKELAEIKNNLEQELNFEFNICLANYYDSGKNSIGYHSDNEEKGSISCIASMSFGVERNFVFRKKNTKDIYRKLLLEHGSLLIMGNGCQENYDHSLPIDKECHEPRLNLTFRLFDGNRYKNH